MFESEKVVEKYPEDLKNELIKDFTDLQWCLQYYNYEKEEFNENPVFRSSTLFGVQRVMNRLKKLDNVWYENLFVKDNIENLIDEINNDSIERDWSDIWNFIKNELPKIIKAYIGETKYDECMEKAYYAKFYHPWASKVARVEIYLNQNFSYKELKKARRIIYWCFRQENVKCLSSSNYRLIFEDDVVKKYAYIWEGIISVQDDYPEVLKYISEAYYYHDGKNDLIREFWFSKEWDVK